MGKNILITSKQFEDFLKRAKGKTVLNRSHDFLNLFNISDKERKTPLVEAYFSTYPIETVLNFLKKRYHDEIYAQKREEANGEEVIYVEFDDLDENQRLIDEDMSLCGFYPSEVKVDGKRRIVCYEKRHQKSVNDIVQEIGKIYHFTRRKSLQKIMKIGLCPRSDNERFDYPERVYFYLEPLSIRDCKCFVRMLAQGTNEPLNLDYALLEINVGGLDVNFYYDPNLSNSVYTTENIPPENIKIYYNKI